MWLDRLAGQATSPSTSQPGSRPYSPVPPRRSATVLGPYITSQQRPGITPRASSLSLASNDSSTSSLLASQKRANGSTLKQSTTTYSGPDPLEVLNALLAEDGEDTAPGFQPNNSVTAGDLELDFDFGGLSLRELALSEDIEAEGTDVHRSQTVEEYEHDKTKFEDLHQSIRTCDEVLSSVETNLTSFRNDLATVSADIETLQARSTALNVRLENRKAVEKRLAPVVDEISVSPLVVSKIAEGHIDESWVKILAEVDKRATTHKNNAAISQNSKGLQDLGPLLEKLVLKAIERIRDFLVSQVKALRSPHINAQIIQQQNFLRFKDLFSFLHRYHATLADEICLAYRNTMRWYYHNQFTRYESALKKIKLHLLERTDVLGNEDTSRKGTVLSSSKISGPPHDAFNLGRRINLLKTKDQAALSSYLAEEDQSTHYLEVPFRNFNLALIDNATAEYTFLASFFSPALSYSAISRHFTYIFEPTFTLGQSLTKSLVHDTYDTLGLLLVVRLNQHFQFELQRRKVPAADSYVNGTAMLLWPRLQVIMDSHSESVRTLTHSLPTRPPAKLEQAKLSTAPHVVTQRFGQLVHGILALSTEAGDEEPVVTSLRRLRAEMEAFLTKYSGAFGTDKRKRERFLYNNYSLILTIISDTTGKLAEEEQEHFEVLKKAFQEDVS
ncbi:Sac2 family-domain-containing protein [Pseudomassariella vexata]|uniref:Sac2 family-domain-containing protein n=1 Tax=Pseudomassariella vexata TaxID=1141098 RepID=A0A1Y2E0M0_9PEZI|nr:Sac2 family-domain-containing protein [Pseudomassariella vexata]ORY64896.1 Sac2 family-domain-containing protein [Pseudomassariella vexata]